MNAATNGELLQARVYWGGRLLEVRPVGGGALERLIEAPRPKRPRGGRPVRLHPPEGAEVHVRSDREGWHRPADGSALELSPREWARVRVGSLTYELSYVPAPEPVPTRILGEDQLPFFKWAAMAALVWIAAVVAIRITPVAEVAAAEARLPDLPHGIERRVPPPIIRVTPPRVAQWPAPGVPTRSAGRGEGGGRSQRPGPGGAPRVGLLEAWEELGGAGVLDRGFGNVDAALQRLEGDSVLSDANGLGGGGSRQSGPGGGLGGAGAGLHLGRIGPGGRGRPGGDGLPLRPLAHGSSVPPSTPFPVQGGLERGEILRVVRRHQSEMKYCYESQLHQEPDLAGKVAVLFVIGPSGEVVEAAVAESSLSSGPVEACMLDRIRRWRFPEPQGGGTVTVTFPWVFRPAGADHE